MFDNSFVDQHRFEYSKPIDNENDETLDMNVSVNIDDNIDIDNDVDIDYELTPYILEFKDVSGSSSIVSHDWAHSHRRMTRGSDLEVGQTFSIKNKIIK